MNGAKDNCRGLFFRDEHENEFHQSSNCSLIENLFIG